MTQDKAIEKLQKLIMNPQPNESYSLVYDGETNKWYVVTKIINNINNTNDDEK